MKNILIIMIIFLSAFINKADAQNNGLPDTLVYLQNIVTNKSNYIGRPFSVLLNDLQIQIKFFSPFGIIPYDKTKETSTSFAFYFPNSALDHYLSYPRLRISWQPYLDNIYSNSLHDQFNGGWVPTVISYYSNAIISDIEIRE